MKAPKIVLPLTETELMLIEQGLKKNETYLKGRYDKLSKETKENNSRILSKIMMARAKLCLKEEEQ